MCLDEQEPDNMWRAYVAFWIAVGAVVMTWILASAAVKIWG